MRSIFQANHSKPQLRQPRGVATTIRTTGSSPESDLTSPASKAEGFTYWLQFWRCVLWGFAFLGFKV